MKLIDAKYEQHDGKLHETFVYEESVFYKPEDEILQYKRIHTYEKIDGLEISHEIRETMHKPLSIYSESYPKGLGYTESTIRKGLKKDEFITEDEMNIP